MKRKATKIPLDNMEKKNSELFIFDLFIQKGESFSISFIEKNFEYRKIYDYKDNIIIPGFYPRIKKIPFYNNDVLRKVTLESFFLKSYVKLNCLENSNSKEKKKLENPNFLPKSNVKSSTNITKNDIKISHNSNEISDKNSGKIAEIFSSNKLQKTELKEICNINNELKELVYKEEKLNLNQIKIIEIEKDGNCFYRCLSYFLLKSQDYYLNIKNLIIDWIENNYDNFLDFFGDDEPNNMTREEIAKQEFDYIKSKDSWGSHYTIAIACLILKIDIAVYTYEGNNIYKPYNLFKIDNEEKELCILNYHNNYHFELIYSIHEQVTENTLYKSFSKINLEHNIKKNNIKITGISFKNNYVEINNLSSQIPMTIFIIFCIVLKLMRKK